MQLKAHKSVSSVSYFYTPTCSDYKYQNNFSIKNDNNVGLLRTVKKYGYKKNTVNNNNRDGLSHEPHLQSKLRLFEPHPTHAMLDRNVDSDVVMHYPIYRG